MQFQTSTSTAWQARSVAGRWPWLVLLTFLIMLPSAAAWSAAGPAPRLTEPGVAGLSLAQQADSNARLAAALDTFREQVAAEGVIDVAVKTGVAFAPEGKLSPLQRLEQRREIAAAAQGLLKALPQAKRFTALEDMPYVILRLDAQGLSRLEDIPGIVRIVRAEHLNWLRDYIETRQAAFAAARQTEQGKASAAEPPRLGIVGGRIADPTTHPFQVALLKKSIRDNFASTFCGGTLVSTVHIVTAAHCVDDILARDLEVLVGTKRLDGSGRRIGVHKIHLAPGWHDDDETRSTGPDAAVLELAEPVTGIRFATIASTEPTVEGTMLRLTGWGNRSPNIWGPNPERDYPIDLMQADMPFIPRTMSGECSGYPATYICVGDASGTPHVAPRDSGGPATIDRGAGYTELVGIVSGVNSDGVSTLASVAHSDVSRFIRGIVFGPQRTIGFQTIARTVGEGERIVTLVLHRPVADAVAQVSFATSNGTAIHRPGSFFTSDYWGSSGTVTFWPGQTRAEIPIQLVDDRVKEGNEFFTVTLSRPSAGWRTTGNAIVTITDND